MFLWITKYMIWSPGSVPPVMNARYSAGLIPPEHHEDVIAIVTIEDVLAYTSLPMRLLRPHAAQ